MGIGAIIFLAIITFAVWIFISAFGIGFEWRNDRAWEKVRNDPFVQVLGRWQNQNQRKELSIPNELLPIGTPYQDWVTTMKNNKFHVEDDKNKCRWSSSALPFLEKYDTCAFKNVGPSDCTYTHIIAANFEDGRLKEAIGTYNEFICY